MTDIYIIYGMRRKYGVIGEDEDLIGVYLDKEKAENELKKFRNSKVAMREYEQFNITHTETGNLIWFSDMEN